VQWCRGGVVDGIISGTFIVITRVQLAVPRRCPPPRTSMTTGNPDDDDDDGNRSRPPPRLYFNSPIIADAIGGL